MSPGSTGFGNCYAGSTTCSDFVFGQAGIMIKNPLPATLAPESVVAITDSREQCPLDLSPLPIRVLVVGSTWETIESHESAMPPWRGKVTKEAVIGSLLGWQAVGFSIHMTGDHARAGRHVARLLYTIAKRRYRELRSFVEVT